MKRIVLFAEGHGDRFDLTGRVPGIADRLRAGALRSPTL